MSSVDLLIGHRMSYVKEILSADASAYVMLDVILSHAD